MDSLSVQIKAIQEKLQILLKQQQLLQKENLKLKKDLEKLQTIIHQLESVKMGDSQWSSSDKLLMEKRIDGYLKEIEKCLLLLNA